MQTTHPAATAAPGSELSPCAIPLIEARLAKMAKRAARLGVECPTLRYERFTRREDRGIDADGKRVIIERPMVRVWIDGAQPAVAGWRPVANLVRTGDQNVFRAPPGVTVPESFRSRHVCDHCSTKRARKETWILRNVDTGALIQVGRTCIQDFFGGACDPATLAFWATAWDACEGAGDPTADYAETADYLACVATAVRVDGWTSASAAGYGRRATWGLAAMIMDPPPLVRGADPLPRPTAADHDTATEALAWIRSADLDSEYLRNLAAACSSDYAHRKVFGLLASLVGAAYPGHVERKAKAQRPASRHYGATGDRIDLACTVLGAHTWRSERFGWKTVVTLCDDAGHTFKWWASREIEDLGTGDRVTVRATVKAHEIDSRTAQPVTIVTRCKIAGIETTEAA